MSWTARRAEEDKLEERTPESSMGGNMKLEYVIDGK